MVNGSAEDNLRFWAQYYCEFIVKKQFKGANLCAGHFMPKPDEPKRVRAFLSWLRRDYGTTGEEAEQEPKPTAQQKERPPMTEKQRDIESRRYRVRE
jgi:hypothetical protein